MFTRKSFITTLAATGAALLSPFKPKKPVIQISKEFQPIIFTFDALIYAPGHPEHGKRITFRTHNIVPDNGWVIINGITKTGQS